MPRYAKNNIVKLHNIFRPPAEKQFRYRFNISELSEKRLRLMMFKWGMSPAEVFERAMQVIATIYNERDKDDESTRIETAATKPGIESSKTGRNRRTGTIEPITSIITGGKISLK